jgi:mannose-6-phosphate isomerase-like protein (cupin superfamily)
MSTDPHRRPEPVWPIARRVVTGLDANGRSTVVADARVTAVNTRPGAATICEVWRSDRLPADLDDHGPLQATTVEPAAASGLVIRVCTFPPERDKDDEEAREYAESVASSYGAGPVVNGTPLHRTETVDTLTVIRGELTLVTETDETVLRQGETVVQRGTMHGWRNRGKETAVVLAIMMGADSAI